MSITDYIPFSDMTPLPNDGGMSIWEPASSLQGPARRKAHLAARRRRYAEGKIEFPPEELFNKRRAATHCEICQKEFQTFREKKGDHNHETGKLRGVLCNRCNTRLGFYESLTSEYEKRIVKYLDRYKSVIDAKVAMNS